MKNFILGFGAHKAGTTWLFRQIKKHPCFKMGIRKEMRFFKGYAQAKKFKSKKNLSLKEQEYIRLIKLFKKNPQEYFDYFAKLVNDNSVSHVGEITPCYCGLNIDQLKFIRENLDKRNFEKKIIFLIRDPYKRILSHFSSQMRRKHFGKMIGAKANRKIKKNPYLLVENYTEEQIIDLIINAYKSESYKLRTKYEIVIPKLLKVFNKEEVFIDFFEDMFNDDFCKRFSQFSNLKDLAMDFSFSSNVSPKFKPLPNEIKSEIINYYKDTYHFINSIYPEKSNNLWKESLSFIS